jgi:hypothetical protein
MANAASKPADASWSVKLLDRVQGFGFKNDSPTIFQL